MVVSSRSCHRKGMSVACRLAPQPGKGKSPTSMTGAASTEATSPKRAATASFILKIMWLVFCTSGLTNVLLSLRVVAETGGVRKAKSRGDGMLWVKRSLASKVSFLSVNFPQRTASGLQVSPGISGMPNKSLKWRDRRTTSFAFRLNHIAWLHGDF